MAVREGSGRARVAGVRNRAVRARDGGGDVSLSPAAVARSHRGGVTGAGEGNFSFTKILESESADQRPFAAAVSVSDPSRSFDAGADRLGHSYCGAPAPLLIFLAAASFRKCFFR